MIKQTVRRFILMIPDGTERKMIRTFIRSSDGIEYPMDQEIDIPKYREHVEEYDGTEVIEEMVLARQPPGTKCVATKDFVTLIEE